MKIYYIDRRPDKEGVYRIHIQGCPDIPLDRLFLGRFEETAAAISAAKANRSQIKCCETCHT
ncbi:hypothetical protein [Penaeicola halotolerans]|uniref:hypothetical protein n=1 Tax=Penaeicola halotolerans TaxID=2793196 RepID=UPI001CF8D3D9|nr:hypothetical protein [Penaeicola halotolerans]